MPWKIWRTCLTLPRLHSLAVTLEQYRMTRLCIGLIRKCHGTSESRSVPVHRGGVNNHKIGLWSHGTIGYQPQVHPSIPGEQLRKMLDRAPISIAAQLGTSQN
ncbi:hypothetical protein CC1G_06108 [Coprinopsis cinerea okayama7|uniref:Secreted protein n=1 Tax=Coprinopsis cinerea (strain Okayama-7 / 130 / ATCC MYA-4618 / FGSC 9003) TaxID=240176 RepID=A8PA70_COPC7|nr:hypothetical protein CC1G_06108 [Coprinopsis cinerea okayama7\|eukprot:XP_001839918.2 hypothetical protein CC1G_06108 [Coprinopsis cinerea okayama7\